MKSRSIRSVTLATPLCGVLLLAALLCYRSVVPVKSWDFSMAPTCRKIDYAPVTVAIEGVHWYSFVNMEGRERFVCMCQPCPAQGDYCRKDALNRHLVVEHKKKTLRSQAVRRRYRGRNRANLAAPRSECHPSGGSVRSIGIHDERQSASKRVGQPQIYVPSSSSRSPLSGPTSTVPGILRRRGKDCSAQPLSSEQTNGEGYGSPAYGGVERRHKLKLLRRKPGQGLPSSSAPIPESQFLSDDDVPLNASPRSPPPLSPIEVTLYSPRQLKVSGYKNVFESVCLPDVGSPFDQFYRDCEPPTCQKFDRGITADRPIRIGVSPHKGLASGIPREGILNARWEGGGKTTFFIPLQKKKGKEKIVADEDDIPILDVESGDVGQSNAGEGTKLNFESPHLPLPSVSQLLSGLHVGLEENAKKGMLSPIEVPTKSTELPPKAAIQLGGDDNAEFDLPPQDGQGNLLASQIPSLSQLPTLSQISLPPIEEYPDVPDCGEITSQQLLDYVSDSEDDSYEL